MRLGLKDTFAWMKDINKPHLWHHTGLWNAINILNDDIIRGNINGNVSLTRRRELPWHPLQVAFQFDKDKLRQKYKISPFNHFSRSERLEFGRQEAEERLRGPLTNIENFLIGIHVPRRLLENLEKTYGDKDSYYFSEQKMNDLNRLRQHPKLNLIEGIPPWEQELRRQLREGTFVDLSNYLDDYAYNLKKSMGL